MSDPEKPKPAAHPESPTTVRELDFDDDTQNSPAAHTPATLTSAAPPPNAPEDIPPPKPPRPLNPQQQAENTLKEAFPSIDAVVVRAVLTASGGQIEPAFNALLGMTDPDSQREPAAPPQPPRPAQVPIGPTSTTQSQVEADEQYARQLAEHYSGSSPYGGQPRSHSRTRRDPAIPRPQRDPAIPRPQGNTGLKPNELYDDRDHSFLDDDLPVIKDSIRKGFLETQSKVNSWVMNLKKRIDGEDSEEYQTHPARSSTNYPSNSPTHTYGSVRRSGELGRRSADRDRYDADPQVLSDDFTSLQLRDEEVPPPRPTRPLANPDLFKPTPSTPSNNPGRRVSFVEGPPEEIDSLYRASPDSSKRIPSSAGGGSRQKKWQPLSAVDPSPVTDHDPFSLGDSDEEDRKRDGDRAKGEGGVETRTGEMREAESRTGGAREMEAEELVGK